jgi:hypothetical protein
MPNQPFFDDGEDYAFDPADMSGFDPNSPYEIDPLTGRYRKKRRATSAGSAAGIRSALANADQNELDRQMLIRAHAPQAAQMQADLKARGIAGYMTDTGEYVAAGTRKNEAGVTDYKDVGATQYAIENTPTLAQMRAEAAAARRQLIANRAENSALRKQQAAQLKLQKAIENAPKRALSEARQYHAGIKQSLTNAKKEYDSWNNSDQGGLAYADAAAKLTEAEQQAQETGGFMAIFNSDEIGKPTRAAVEAKGSLEGLRAKAAILARQKEAYETRLAQVSDLETQSRAEFNRLNDAKLGVTFDTVSNALIRENAARARAGVPGIDPAQFQPTPPDDSAYNEADPVHQLVKQTNEKRVNQGRTDFIDPADMSPYAGSANIEEETVQQASQLNNTSMALELGRLKAIGTTHVGAQPIDTFIEKYGGDAAIDNDRLVEAYKRTAGRMADISATLENPDTDPRVAKSLQDEAAVLGRVLAEKELLVKNRGQWDRVRDLNATDYIKGAYAAAWRGALGTVSGGAEAVARNVGRVFGQDMGSDYQKNVAEGFDAVNNVIETEDAGALIGRVARGALLHDPTAFTDPATTQDENITQKFGDTLTSTIATGAGSTVPFMAAGAGAGSLARAFGLGAKATGFLANASTALSGAAVSANEFRDQAEQGFKEKLASGEMTQEEYDSALNASEAWGAIAGTSEVLPLGKFFGQVAKFNTGKIVTKGIANAFRKGGASGAADWIQGAGKGWVRQLGNEIATEAAEEGTQEFGQAVMNNLTSHGMLGNRGWEERQAGFTGGVSDTLGGDSLEGAAAGAVTGALLGGIFGVGRLRGRKPPALPAANPAVQPAQVDQNGNEVLQPTIDPELQAQFDAQYSPHGIDPNSGIANDAGTIDPADEQFMPLEAAQRPQESAKTEQTPANDQRSVQNISTAQAVEQGLIAESYADQVDPEWRTNLQGPAAGNEGQAPGVAQPPVSLSTTEAAQDQLPNTLPTTAPAQSVENQPEPERTQDGHINARGLKQGQVIVTDNLGSVKILGVDKMTKKDGTPRDGLVEVEFEDGKQTYIKASQLQADLSPSPYTDANTGERKMSEPARFAEPTAPVAPTAPSTPAPSVEQAPDAAASSAGREVVSGAASEGQPVTEKPKGKRIGVGTPANGEPDLLNIIEDLGGIKHPSKAMNVGGEYDGFKGTMQGTAKALVRNDGRGQTPDQLHKELTDAYGMKFDSVDSMYSAIAAAVDQRRTTAKAVKQENYVNKFEAAFMGDQPTQKYWRGDKPVTLDMLEVGDTFNVNGEQFAVKKIDADGNVTVGGTTGDAPLTRTYPGDSTVYPDKGQLTSLPKPESQRPLENHPADAQPQAPTDDPYDPDFKFEEGAYQPGEQPARLNPASLRNKLAQAAKVAPESPQARVIGGLATRLNRANPKAFAEMKVVVLDNAQWSESEALNLKAPNSAGAYYQETNTLYINSDKANADNIGSVFTHEAGHFAERFGLGEEFTQREWESLTDEQRSAAWQQYSKKKIDGAKLKNSPRARSEWVAMQFARVVRGETEGMAPSVKLKLAQWLGVVREMVNRWVGDGKLTTKQLDAKILEMLRVPNVTERAELTIAERLAKMRAEREASQKASDEAHAERMAFLRKKAGLTPKVEQPAAPPVIDQTGQTSLLGPKDDTFSLSSTEQEDGGNALKKAQDKREQDAKQPDLFPKDQVSSLPPTKLDGQNAQNRTPAPKPSSKLDAADDQAIRDAFDGMLGAPATTIAQKEIPADKQGQFLNLARQLIGKGITTPQELGAELDRVLNKKARGFSESLWDLFGVADKKLRGTHDWDSIYGKMDAPEQAPAPKPQPKLEQPAPASTAPVHESVRDYLLQVVDDKAVPLTRSNLHKQFPALAGMDSKTADEAIELGIVLAARELAKDGDPKVVYPKMVRLYAAQPNLTAKTSESKINQAYSTPAPMAYIASRLAEIVDGISVLEPTAGNGMLLMEAGAAGQKVVANEIDPLRADNLRQQQFVVSQKDATTAEYGAQVKRIAPDRIITNPPFGALKVNGKSMEYTVPMEGGGTLLTTNMDMAITLQALQGMKPDGKAVLIIGSGAGKAVDPEARRNAYISGQKFPYFAELYNNYNVTSHITVDGDLYAKQGAGWPVDIITIDGKAKSALPFPWVKEPQIYDNWNDLGQLIGANAPTNVVAGEDQRPGGSTLVSGPKGDTGGSGAGNGPAGNSPVTKPASGSNGEAGSGKAGGGSGQSGVSGQAPAVSPPSSVPGGQVSSQSGSIEREGDGVERGQGGPGAPDDVSVEVNDTGFQAAYKPVSKAPQRTNALVPVNLLHPIQEALRNVEKRHGDLVEYVRSSLGYKSNDALFASLDAGQIDAVALAIDNFQRGGSLITGDQTGMGKGRICAALMRYALKNGKTPIFFTKDPGLYADMLRDLKDIEMDHVVPFITNNKISVVLEDSDGNIVKQFKTAEKKDQEKSMADARASGGLPGNASVVFSSYDQIKSDVPAGFKETPKQAREREKAKKAPPDGERMKFIREFSKDALIILDESHLAGGNSSTGWRMQQLVQANKYNTYYSSATFAKRPDNMPIYMATDIKYAVSSPEQFQEIMVEGGVPMQQVTTTMLARAGQFVRRELDFTGVQFQYRTTGRTEQERQMVDSFVEPLRSILDFNESFNDLIAEIAATIRENGEQLEDGTILADRLQSTEIFSELHNIVNCYLLAMKADGIADTAIEQLKAGKSPVVTMFNTMEGAMERVAEFGHKLNFNGLLHTYLDKSLKIVVKSPNGTKRTVRINIDDIQAAFPQIPAGKFPAKAIPMIARLQEAYRQVQTDIDAEDRSAIPVSPIDHIQRRIEDAGFGLREISGRQSYLNRKGKIESRPSILSKKQGHNKVLAEFNRSPGLTLLLTRSGSTGISAHASEKFKNQRQRVMIVGQILPDVNDMIQMFGRVFRKGQVLNPEYIVLSSTIPAEKRLSAILSKKLRSLNANTTGDGDGVNTSAGGGIDFLNKYGDQAARIYLRAHPEISTLIRSAGVDIDDQNSGYGTGDYVRKISGEVAILPYDEQEAFYNGLLEEYSSIVSYLDSVGLNDLSAQVLDLRAKTVSRSQIFSSSGDSVFAAPAYLEEVSTVAARQPMKPEDINQMYSDKKGERLEALQKARSAVWKAERDAVAKSKEEYAKSAESGDTSNKNREKHIQESSETIHKGFNMVGKAFVYTPGPGIRLIGFVHDFAYNEEKPLTPSAHSLKIAVNGEPVNLTLPLSQLDKLSELGGFSYAWEGEYRSSSAVEQKRAIITGNLLGGWAAIKSLGGQGGRIVIYTTESGSRQPGMLMPAGFMSGKKFEYIETPSRLIELASDSVSPTTAGGLKFYAMTMGGRRGASVSVPASKRRGGVYWQNRKFLSLFAGGQLEEKQGFMVGFMPEANYQDMIDFLKSIKDPLYAITETPEAAAKRKKDALQRPRRNDGPLGSPAEELPAKGTKADDGSYFRSLPISLNQAGIEVALETYRRLPNAEPTEVAKQIIEAGEDAAYEVAMGERGELPAVVHNAIAIQLFKKMQAQLAKVAPEQANELRRKIQALSSTASKNATEYGQAVQIYATLSPTEAATRSVVNGIEEEQDEATGGKGFIRQVSKILKDSGLKPEDIAPIIDKITGVMPVTKSIWQKYRDQAAKRVLALFDTSPKKPSPLLQAFTNRVTDELRAKLEAIAPKRAKEVKMTPAQIIGEALKNPEKYAEAWETARAALEKDFPDQIDAIDDLMADLGARPYSKKQLDRAIRDAHKQLKVKLQDLARQHFSKANTSIDDLKKAIIAETGVTEANAAVLAKDIVEKIGANRKEAQVKILKQMAEKHATAKKQRATIHAIEKAIRLNNLGAFDEVSMRDFIAKEMKLPNLTADHLKEIARLGDAVEMAPNAMEKHRAELDLAHYLRRIRGFSVTDIVTAMFFANMLSGPKTHIANAAGNAVNGTLQLATVAITNPKQMGTAVSGYLAGFKTGWDNARSIMSTGRGTAELDARSGEAGNVLESVNFKRDFSGLPKSAATVLQTVTALKYVTRSMRAMDAVFFHPAKEAYTRVAVAKLMDGQYEGKALRDKVREVLQLAPDQYLAAKAKAEAEGWTGMDLALRTADILGGQRKEAIDKQVAAQGGDVLANDNPTIAADRFALQTTYNNIPEGWAGVLYKHLSGLTGDVPAAKVVLPFLRIPTNIFNSSLNFTPVGILRAGTGKTINGITSDGDNRTKSYHQYTADERSRMFVQGVAGSLMIAGLILMALKGDEDKEKWFDISAGGPMDFAKRAQLEATGWMPHAIKLGDRWFSYKDSGLLLPLSIAGNTVEQFKYHRSESWGIKLAKAFRTAPAVIFDTSMLSGLGQFMGYVQGTYESKDGRKLTEFLAKVPFTVVTPNLLNQVDRAFDDDARQSDNFGQKLRAAVPFARRLNPTSTDVLGTNKDTSPRFTNAESNDPVREVLRDKGLFISTPSKETKLRGVQMTPDQYREYVKISGEAIARRLKPAVAAIRLMPTEKKVMKDGVVSTVNPAEQYVDKIVADERTRAKLRMQMKR